MKLWKLEDGFMKSVWELICSYVHFKDQGNTTCNFQEPKLYIISFYYT